MYKLTQQGSGNAVVIVPGGASESLLCRPGVSTVLLNKRKGFVKLALKTGWVPMFRDSKVPWALCSSSHSGTLSGKPTRYPLFTLVTPLYPSHYGGGGRESVGPLDSLVGTFRS